jgi:hypothetical protein
MASVQAYDIAYRVRVLRGRTQAELMRLVASDLGVTLSSPEFNRILHGYYGGGDKTQKVLAKAHEIVCRWEDAAKADAGAGNNG